MNMKMEMRNDVSVSDAKTEVQNVAEKYFKGPEKFIVC